jgi:hypothetical protein
MFKKICVLFLLNTILYVAQGHAMLRMLKYKSLTFPLRVRPILGVRQHANKPNYDAIHEKFETLFDDYQKRKVDFFHQTMLKDFKNKKGHKIADPQCCKGCSCQSHYMLTSGRHLLLEGLNSKGDNTLAMAVKKQRLWAVEALLEKYHVDTHVRDKNGDLPLKVALTKYLRLVDEQAADTCKDLDNNMLVRKKHPLYVKSTIASRIATMIATRMCIRGEKLVPHEEVAAGLGKTKVLDQALIEKEVNFIHAVAKKGRDEAAAKLKAFEQAKKDQGKEADVDLRNEAEKVITDLGLSEREIEKMMTGTTLEEELEKFKNDWLTYRKCDNGKC